MTAPPPPRVRAALTVAPRLLADSLASLLREAGVDVVVDAPPDEHVDVAVTTAGRAPASSDVVVELDDGRHGTAVATAREHQDGPTLQLTGLAAIIAFVSSWSPREHHRAAPRG